MGQTIRRDLRQTSKEQAEDNHREEGLDDGPCGPDRGLLVANLNVPPDEEIEEFSVRPYPSQVRPDPSGRWRDKSRYLPIRPDPRLMSDGIHRPPLSYAFQLA